MSALQLAAAGPSVEWYVTRASGIVSTLLLTGSIVLGVMDVGRISSPRWPRFVLDALHRNVALLAVCFVVVHILTAVLDSFTSISLSQAVLPFVGSYRPFWLGLGAVAFDLLIAVTLTSIARRHIGFGAWRAIHWASYACWPIALLHGLGTGSDTKSAWALLIYAACTAAVLAALAVRVLQLPGERRERGRLAFAGAGVFTLALVLWLPSGPLGSGWARRSGTPSSVLPGSARHAASGSR